MRTALLSILIASLSQAQIISGDYFIDHEGNVGPNIFLSDPSDKELDHSIGKDAWQFLVPARKRFLEQYAKTCYRDFRGEIWTTWFSEQVNRQDEAYIGRNPPIWFNLNRQFGGSHYKPVSDDAEPISAQELLGAMINQEIKVIHFVRERRETRGPVYERVLITTNGSRHYRGDYPIPEKQGTPDRGGLWIYGNRRVDGPRYETVWGFREQSFPVDSIRRRVCR